MKIKEITKKILNDKTFYITIITDFRWYEYNFSKHSNILELENNSQNPDDYDVVYYKLELGDVSNYFITSTQEKDEITLMFTLIEDNFDTLDDMSNVKFSKIK